MANWENLSIGLPLDRTSTLRVLISSRDKVIGQVTIPRSKLLGGRKNQKGFYVVRQLPFVCLLWLCLCLALCFYLCLCSCKAVSILVVLGWTLARFLRNSTIFSSTFYIVVVRGVGQQRKDCRQNKVCVRFGGPCCEHRVKFLSIFSVWMCAVSPT